MCRFITYLVMLAFLFGLIDRAEGQTSFAFYVDPDVAIGGDGSDSHPWTRLNSGRWDIINQALESGDVTVYFSAREADIDHNETTDNVIYNTRVEPSTHRLTLDGMSRYNGNDQNPVWYDYTGPSRFQIRAPYPISGGEIKRNYVTYRGFRLIATQGQGIAYWGGDHVVIEHCEISADNPLHGPGIWFGYAASAGSEIPNGGCIDLTIRHNTVHHNYGEGIYIGGVENQNLPGHDGITIEYNTVYDVGTWGGEPDAVDIKDGNRNVVVRGNTLFMSIPATGRDGINIGGAGLIEGNFIYNMGRNGITLGTFWNAYPNRDGAMIRNNIIVNCGGNPDYGWDYGLIVEGSPSGDQWTNTRIYNNTIGLIQNDGSGDGNGITIYRQVRNTEIINNLLFDCAGVCLTAGKGSLGRHDYNLFFSPVGGPLVRYGRAYSASDLQSIEPHSITLDPQLVDMTPPYATEHFKLKVGSPAIDTGQIVPLSGDDFFGMMRPQGSGWDIGAHEFKN